MIRWFTSRSRALALPAALLANPSARLAGALANHYRIERELGAGGMATVYLAEDLKHHREVAIKVLREDLAASMGSVRFLREIHIAAQLQHPHILPLLDSGEAEGFLYYVMPYVKGQSLRERIAREGELPIHEAVRLIIEVVDALAHAHEHGVVHRDIKPDNVMLSGRHALVADFGVAKAISEATGRSAATTFGMAVGTPAYMSPEQAAADPHIDHRADIYAVGVMTYELLTGQTPFNRATTQQVLAAQVSEAPDPVSRRRPGVSPALDAIIMRCLAKRPADRFQSAGDLLAQLEALATPAAGMTSSSGTPTHEPAREGERSPTRRRIGLAIVALVVVVVIGVAWWRLGGAHPVSASSRTIAVLPFENAGGDSAFDYLAEGITNDLRTGLKTALPALSMKARSSSASAKGRTIHDAGALLDVGVLLQGTVRHSAANVIVTVDLVNVPDESSMWSGKFILPPDGNFASAQDSISSAVARALRMKPASGVGTALVQRGTNNQDAYDLFLRGQYHLARNDNRGAVALLQKAVARDPKFARAHAWLAIAYAGLPNMGVGSADSALALAEESADRATALDSNLVDGRLAIASIRLAQMRFAEAEHELAGLLRRDPDNPDLHSFYGFALGLRGHIVEELEEQRRAHMLDPLNPNPLLAEQYLLYVLGRNREAIDATRLILDLDPNSAGAYLAMGAAYVFIGRPDSAVRALEQGVRIDSTAYGDRIFTMFGYAASGRWADAARERDIVLREERNSPNVIQAFVGVTFGQYDSAAAAMDRALEHREPLILTMRWSCDPMFNPIKAHPRFVAAAKRVGAVICPATVAWPIGSARH